MDRHSLPLNMVNPFVRYSHYFTIEESTPFVQVRSYDYRMIYIYDGSGNMEIDNHLYPVAKGSLFMWRPAVKYSFLPKKGDRITAYGINFDFTNNNQNYESPIVPDTDTTFQENNITGIVEFIDFAPFNKVVYLKNMMNLEEYFYIINHEFMIQKNFYQGKIHGIFIALVNDIARSLSATTNGETDDSNELIDTIIEYIQSHYDQPLTNKALGQIFSFHPAYISRMMVKHTGLPLHRYITQQRIYAALNLLQTTNLSVSEIAAKVGISDINYFSRCFKKYVGYSPRNFLSVKKPNTK